jgi:hypothetical protein
MRYAIIKDDIIENVIVADQDFATANYPDAIECPDTFGVGDSYIDGEFKRITIAVNDEPLP